VIKGDAEMLKNKGLTNKELDEQLEEINQKLLEANVASSSSYKR